jgi:hypothetical protein
MLTRLLTILPLLLCPLLMLSCMWAIRNRGTAERHAHASHQELPTAARVAQLERELADLRGRLPQAGTLAADAPTPQPDHSPGSRNGTPVPPG